MEWLLAPDPKLPTQPIVRVTPLNAAGTVPYEALDPGLENVDAKLGRLQKRVPDDSSMTHARWARSNPRRYRLSVLDLGPTVLAE